MMWKIVIMLMAVIAGETLPVKDYDPLTTTNTEEECLIILNRTVHDMIKDAIMHDPAIEFLETKSLKLYSDCKEVTNVEEDNDANHSPPKQ